MAFFLLVYNIVDVQGRVTQFWALCFNSDRWWNIVTDYSSRRFLNNFIRGSNFLLTGLTKNVALVVLEIGLLSQTVVFNWGFILLLGKRLFCNFSSLFIDFLFKSEVIIFQRVLNSILYGQFLTQLFYSLILILKLFSHNVSDLESLIKLIKAFWVFLLAHIHF